VAESAKGQAEALMGKLDLDLLRRLPAYPFVEAAHYLDLPTSTLRAWCVGQDHPDKGHPPRNITEILQTDHYEILASATSRRIEVRRLAAEG